VSKVADNKAVLMPKPLIEGESFRVYTVTIKTYQDQLNAG